MGESELQIAGLQKPINIEFTAIVVVKKSLKIISYRNIRNKTK